MRFNKIHMVTFSPCGGTSRVLKALAEGVGLPAVEHDITTPKKRRKKLSFSENDLVVFGFPVYGGRMPRNIKEVFTCLEGSGTPCALVAVYGNRAFEGALIDLHHAAQDNGFVPVVAIAAIAEHSMVPELASARPDNADKEKLVDFGGKFLERAIKGAPLEKAPGAMPQWKMPEGGSLFPTINEKKCVLCGHCVEVCAAGAIRESEPNKTDYEKCVVCAACVKFCPQHAREMGTAKTRGMFQHHLDEAASRKEAEIFYE